ncbi:uncharacterized protein LOC111104438 [Crassostrea virginica]
MKTCFGVLSVIFVFFARTNEQCQYMADKTITSCDGSQKTGPRIFVDTNKINRPCNCTVVSFFTGSLRVSANPYTTHFCYNVAKINLAWIQCQDGGSESTVVKDNDTVIIRADYAPQYQSGDFYQCLEISENDSGDKKGNSTVTCGNPINVSPQRAETTLSTESVTNHIDDYSTNIVITSTASVGSLSKTFTSPMSDNVVYIITGAVAGGLIMVACVVLVITIIIAKKRRIKDDVPKNENGQNHINTAFEERSDLPDNPLYHSNVPKPVDEVGYSTIQKEQLGLPPTDEANKNKRDPDYDVPPNNKPIKDPEASSLPIYAVPNKSATNSPEDNQVQAMYAQVSKPRKGSPQVPVQSANQDGLMYLEVVNNSAIVNQNTPYTMNENKDGVTYAEIKHNENVQERVDFYQMNQPCACTLKASFSGDLLVTAKSDGYHKCKNEVTVSFDTTTSVFNCESTYPSSITFNVTNSEAIVNVKTNYTNSHTSWDLPICLGINQNGGLGGIVNVQCGQSTSSEIISSESTKNMHSSQENLTENSDNLIYTIAGAVAGSIVVLVLVVLIVMIIIKNRKKEKHKSKETDEATDHTNRAFDENEGLPDNPLYHSHFAEPVDEVGYSTAQKEQLGLPPTDEARRKRRDSDCDVQQNNKQIKDLETSSMPIYAVPNKSAVACTGLCPVQAVYAQVSKPRKGAPQVPVQTANQDGLMYLEVDNNAAIVNQNTPYTKNENNDGVTYAEIKRD